MYNILIMLEQYKRGAFNRVVIQNLDQVYKVGFQPLSPVPIIYWSNGQWSSCSILNDFPDFLCCWNHKIWLFDV